MGRFSSNKSYNNVREYAEEELAINAASGKMLERSFYGNTVYTLVETTKGEKYIAIDVVQKSNGEWSHKPMDESVHPYHYDCPERMLKQSTSKSPLSIEWREKCREIRKSKRALKNLFASMESGTTLTTVSGRKVVFVRPFNINSTQFVCRDVENCSLFRYRLDYFEYKTVLKDLEEYEKSKGA